MARHFKVNDLLSDADRPAYEELLRRPSTTIDVAHAWLTERGLQVCRGAVHNHFRHFRLTSNGVQAMIERQKKALRQVELDVRNGVTAGEALAKFAKILGLKYPSIRSPESTNAAA
jgi:hypothetical protein